MSHPSEDPINEQANLWMTDLKAKQVRAPQAAKVQTLAHELHIDAEKLAKRIPSDTLRRLKFPMVEERLPDGTTVFKEDKGIVEGRRGLIATDHNG